MKIEAIEVNIFALPIQGAALCALLSGSSNCFSANYVGYVGGLISFANVDGDAGRRQRSVTLIAPHGRIAILEAALELMEQGDDAVESGVVSARRTVLLTAAQRTAEVMQAVQAGIGVFLDEAEEPEQFFAAIYSAVRGAHYRSPDLADLVHKLSRADSSAEAKQDFSGKPKNVARVPVTSLTPRERQVALLIADGYSDAEAARELFVSPQTVNSHLKAIYQKLNIRRRTQLSTFVR